MVMSKYGISNTAFAPLRAGTEPSETLSNSPRGNLFPASGSKATPRRTPHHCTDPPQRRHPLCSHPGVPKKQPRFLLDLDHEQCTRNGPFSIRLSFGEMEVTYWCLLGYCLPTADAVGVAAWAQSAQGAVKPGLRRDECPRQTPGELYFSCIIRF